MIVHPVAATTSVERQPTRSRLSAQERSGRDDGVGGCVYEKIIRHLTLAAIVLVAVEFTLLSLDALLPPNTARAERSSPVALDRRGAWLRALPVENGRWRIRADLDRTDPVFVARLTRIEDARFYLHKGVDPLSLIRAVGSAIVHGHATSGASTLTMQTARLLEPHPRTILGKLGEMVRAVQLETRFSKRQIMAMYLTLAPYGGNLEGVRAASLSWFGHEPQTLTDAEQALLIALPQSPEARRPDRHPVAARAARHAVLARMLRAGLIGGARMAEADAEPLPRRVPFPSLAWHAAGRLARAAPPDQASIVTTLDANLQRRLEALAAATAATQGDTAQVGIMVVEVRNRAVRAAVGSAGRGRPGGWIDMTRALRSPGSALKPLIYGFAFDEGVATPDTRLDDEARRFADYAPEDFDRVFHGQVSAREALMHSLNVPAVTLLDRIGAAGFEARLRGAGVRLVRPRAGLVDPGLALALGGEGMTLSDLTLLYAALGDGGVAKPLAWTEADAARTPGLAGTRLLRAPATDQVLDILRETPAPKGRAPSPLTRGGPPVAFKTGTSYGYRDALAAGVAGGYAIAVWTGRADGGARVGLTGREAALPLLFDVADAIGLPASAPRPIAPDGASTPTQRLSTASPGPRLLFPPDGAVVIADGFGPMSRGLALAAEGDGLAWYIDGAPIPPDPAAGRPIWRPTAPGFYRVAVIDRDGRASEARVRVKGAP
jgi:penicillin-binding protein 1C